MHVLHMRLMVLSLISLSINQFAFSDTLSVSVTPSANPVCAGDSVLLTATPVNGGSNPLYQWYVNGVLVSPSPTCVTLNNGLIACYPFNGNANDESGNSINGTLYGPILTSDRFGNTNSAFSFDGINDYIKADASSLPTADRTISLWFRANSLDTHPVTIAYGGISCGESWFEGINHGGQQDFMLEGHCEAHHFDYLYTTPPIGEWYHWVITTDPSGCTMYLNGALVSQNTHFVNNTYVSGKELGIGVCVTPWGTVPYTDSQVGYFSGKLDDIRIYNRSLTASEVHWLYTMGDSTYSYLPQHGDTIYCIVTSTDTSVVNNPDTSNFIIMTVEDCNNPCTGIDSVLYEGTTYHTVPIGTQCWLKENLDAGIMVPGTQDQTDNGIREKYCYQNSPVNCATYGGLYQWEEIMEYTAYPLVQGICPSGWRIPSDNDWKILEGTTDGMYGVGHPVWDQTGMRGYHVGLNLKDSLNWINGHDQYGFSALQTGYWNSAGQEFGGLPESAFFWTSDNSGTGFPYRRGLNQSSHNSDRTAAPSKEEGYAVRCIRDTCSATDTLSISIQSSATRVCSGMSITVTASVINGGPSASFQWKVNGINRGATGNTFALTPANGDVVTCRVTAFAPCTYGNPAMSNAVEVLVDPSPDVSFSLCWPVTTRDAIPVVLNGGLPLAGAYTGTGIVNGIIDPSLVPAGQDTVIVTYTYINDFGCPDAASALLHIHPSPNHICGNLFTDVRDGTVYPTVQIGTQCWMAENLHFGGQITAPVSQRNNCVAEFYCYNNDPVPCALSSVLYQWDELMDYREESGLVQGLCPPGWHIPSEAEWQQLFMYYIAPAFAANQLKATGYSGFNASLEGFLACQQSWSYGSDNATLNSALFWTSTPSGDQKAFAHGINTVLADPTWNTGVSSYSAFRHNGFSVRCVKN